MCAHYHALTDFLSWFNLQDILFDFNAQHDCVFSQCEIGDSDIYIRQERLETDVRQKHLAHSNDARYLLNMHALHNAHLIRDTLPRTLVAPIPYKPPTIRAQFHRDMAASLQVSGPEKRANTQAKAKETRERKKKEKVSESAHAATVRGSAISSIIGTL